MLGDEHVILEGKVMWAFLDKPNHFDYYGLFLIPNKKSLQVVKENNFYNFKEERGHVSLQNKELDFSISLSIVLMFIIFLPCFYFCYF